MDDLSRYRWHTGARLRRLEPEERVPPLFRDVGPLALIALLRGELQRLAGPFTPLTYLRSHRYREPYVDHARTGRLVVLCGRALGVWHSGLEHVYVASAARRDAAAGVGYLPGGFSPAEAAARLDGATTPGELREALGGRAHDERRREDLASLLQLEGERAAAERALDALRLALQNGEHEARRRMHELGIDEEDLCTAWHHLPAERRHLLSALGRSQSPR